MGDAKPNPYFIRDFGGPATFYKLVNSRQNERPLFLERLLRPKRNNPKPISLEVRVNEFCPSKCGSLIACCCTVELRSDAMPESISIISLEEIAVDRNQQVNHSFFLLSPNTAQQYRKEVNIAVVAFCPSSSSSRCSTKVANARVNTSEVILAKCLENYFLNNADMKPGSSTAAASSVYLCIFEFLSTLRPIDRKPLARQPPSLTGRSAKKFDNGHTSPQEELNPRLFLLPAATTPMKVQLSSLPKCNSRIHLFLGLDRSEQSSAGKNHQECERGLSGKQQTLRDPLNSANEYQAEVYMRWHYEKQCSSSASQPRNLVDVSERKRQGRDGVSVDELHHGDEVDVASTTAIVNSQQLGLTDDTSRPLGVYFHFLYPEVYSTSSTTHSTPPPQPVVEYRKCLECCWCGFLPCKKGTGLGLDTRINERAMWDKSTRLSVASLLVHLSSSHLHFSYENFGDQFGNLHIAIRRDRSQDLSAEAIIIEKWIPFAHNAKRRQKTRAWLRHLVLPVVELALSDDEDEKEEVASSGLVKKDAATERTIRGERDKGGSDKVAAAVRQYYHARTGIPIVDEELVFDSDQETDKWQDLSTAHRMLDEFEDVSYEEKEFMKLWNSHINAFPPYSDCYLAVVAERFVTRFADTIARRKLRYNLLLHLINLWDFGLLRGEEIQRCMAVVDKRVMEIASSSEALSPRQSSYPPDIISVDDDVSLRKVSVGSEDVENRGSVLVATIRNQGSAVAASNNKSCNDKSTATRAKGKKATNGTSTKPKFS